MDTLVCRDCQVEKPLNTKHFYKARTKLGWRPDCKVCVNVKKQAWRAANPERHRESNRLQGNRYYHAHTETISAQAKARYWANHATKRAKANAYNATRRPQNRAQGRKHYAANSVTIRAKNHAYALAHPEEKRQRDQAYNASHAQEIRTKRAAKRLTTLLRERAYIKAHPGYTTVKNNRRRARLLDAPVNDLTPAQWEDIKNTFNHRCAYCKRKMKRLTMDHITPLIKGGSHTMQNVVPACKSCNSKKQAGAPPVPVQPLLL